MIPELRMSARARKERPIYSGVLKYFPLALKGHWVWDETYRCPTHGPCAVIDGKCETCGVVAEVVTHV